MTIQRLCGIVLIFALGLANAATAQTYIAVNRLQVVPIGDGSFEVIEARGEGARGIWCAAADYALSRDRQGAGKRLYVKRARGPSATVQGRKGVVFTTDASTLGTTPAKSLSVTVRTVGVGLPVNHAVQFCRDNIIEPEDILLRRYGG